MEGTERGREHDKRREKEKLTSYVSPAQSRANPARPATNNKCFKTTYKQTNNLTMQPFDWNRPTGREDTLGSRVTTDKEDGHTDMNVPFILTWNSPSWFSSSLSSMHMFCKKQERENVMEKPSKQKH